MLNLALLQNIDGMVTLKTNSKCEMCCHSNIKQIEGKLLLRENNALTYFSIIISNFLHKIIMLRKINTEVKVKLVSGKLWPPNARVTSSSMSLMFLLSFQQRHVLEHGPHENLTRYQHGSWPMQ